ncbi:MAG: hypothetical protein ACUVT5_04170 [Candidatus Bathyarchaeales archaeon]
MEGKQQIFPDFAADNSRLNIQGNQNFTLQLNEDRAGVLLEISVPRNRGYTTQLNGEPLLFYRSFHHMQILLSGKKL